MVNRRVSSVRAIIINGRDNVATVVEEVGVGEEVECGGEKVKALERIPQGHKIALRDLPAGTQVIKYGLPIGVASRAIRRGQWVHVHNVASQRAGQGVAEGRS